MNNNIKNQQGGFLKLIIFIIVALFLLKYFFDISVQDVIDWIKNLISSFSSE